MFCFRLFNEAVSTAVEAISNYQILNEFLIFPETKDMLPVLNQLNTIHPFTLCHENRF